MNIRKKNIRSKSFGGVKKLYAPTYKTDFNNSSNIWNKVKGRTGFYELTKDAREYDFRKEDLNKEAWFNFGRKRWKKEKPEKVPYSDPDFLKKRFPAFERNIDPETQKRLKREHRKRALLNSLANNFKNDNHRLLPENEIYRVRERDLPDDYQVPTGFPSPESIDEFNDESFMRKFRKRLNIKRNRSFDRD